MFTFDPSDAGRPLLSDDSETQFSPGRERLILFVLAAVQFTSIVDFMIVMPLGPQLERELGLTPATFGQIVSSYTYAAGVAGLFASVLVDRFARRTAFLSVFAGFLLGTLACGSGAELRLAARGSSVHRRVRRHSRRAGARDHRRRLSGKPPRLGVGRAHDRIRRRVGRRRTARHRAGQPIRLACAVRHAGGARRPGVLRRRIVASKTRSTPDGEATASVRASCATSSRSRTTCEPSR